MLLSMAYYMKPLKYIFVHNFSMSVQLIQNSIKNKIGYRNVQYRM